MKWTVQFTLIAGGGRTQSQDRVAITNWEFGLNTSLILDWTQL